MLDADLFRKSDAAPTVEDRAYQGEALEAVFDYWADGGENPLVDMATGTGKSVVIAKLIRRILESYPDMRILKLVHVKELVEQNALALLRAWPGAPIGINSAGLGRRDRHSQILFASVQSVFRRGETLGPRDLIVIDEGHLVPRDGEGMYLTLLDKLRDTVPDLRVCGFTATPYRLDSGRLDQGPDRLFSKIVYSYGIAQGVRDGYLSPLVSKSTAIEIDVSGVARRGGEFVAGSLENAANNQAVIESACNEIAARGADRRGMLIFCAGVSHAMNVRDALRAIGIHAETVTAETPNGERDRLFAQYRAGRIRALTGMNVFTTGFDVPHVDLIACLRPTLSTGLYVQMLGRGTRKADGKENCLVLDFAGNVRRHGPVDDIFIDPKIPRLKDDDEEQEYAVRPETVRARICPECGSYNALAARACVDCGHEWPVKHEAKPDNVPVMASSGPHWINVSDVTYQRHEKFDGEGPVSLRVEYQCGLKQYREWVCFEHSGFARAKAHSWWRVMAGTAAPATVAEAIKRQDEINRPYAITIKRESKKFWKVTGYRVRAEGGALEYDDRYRARIVEDEIPDEEPAPTIKRTATGAIDYQRIARELDDDDKIPF